MTPIANDRSVRYAVWQAKWEIAAQLSTACSIDAAQSDGRVGPNQNREGVCHQRACGHGRNSGRAPVVQKRKERR